MLNLLDRLSYFNAFANYYYWWSLRVGAGQVW
jgi:hypothetical protein